MRSIFFFAFCFFAVLLSLPARSESLVVLSKQLAIERVAKTESIRNEDVDAQIFPEAAKKIELLVLKPKSKCGQGTCTLYIYSKSEGKAFYTLNGSIDGHLIEILPSDDEMPILKTVNSVGYETKEFILWRFDNKHHVYKGN